MKSLTNLTGLLLIAVMTLSGCTSYKSVAVKQTTLNTSHYFQTSPPLYAGDKVKYLLKSGQQGELSVGYLTPQNIVGNNGVVLPMTQIDTLERQDISKTKTAAAVGCGVVTTAIVVGVILTVSFATALAAATAG